MEPVAPTGSEYSQQHSAGSARPRAAISRSSAALCSGVRSRMAQGSPAAAAGSAAAGAAAVIRCIATVRGSPRSQLSNAMNRVNSMHLEPSPHRDVLDGSTARPARHLPRQAAGLERRGSAATPSWCKKVSPRPLVNLNLQFLNAPPQLLYLAVLISLFTVQLYICSFQKLSFSPSRSSKKGN